MRVSERSLSIRGLPDWLIREYLAEMGATSDGNDASRPCVVADHWSAIWTSRKVSIPGARFGLTQFDIVFTGDSSAVEEAQRRFMQKAQRGGG